jgi:hypothetical protein
MLISVISLLTYIITYFIIIKVSSRSASSVSPVRTSAPISSNQRRSRSVEMSIDSKRMDSMDTSHDRQIWEDSAMEAIQSIVRESVHDSIKVFLLL